MKKVIFVATALPYNSNDVIYKLAAVLGENNVESDLHAAILPENGRFHKYYSRISFFSQLQKNLEKALQKNNYDAVIFNSKEAVGHYYERIKSLSKSKIILLNNLDNTETIDAQFDLETGSTDEVLDFICKKNNAKSKRVSIIMLTFNQLELTKQCLESLDKYTVFPWELIVVDNGSTDGTPDYLEKYRKNLKADMQCIFNKENRAFSKANNQGIKLAVGDYILLLNNDVILTQKWLERLITCIEGFPKTGLAGPCTNIASGAQRIVPGYDDIRDLHKFAAGFSMKNTGRWIDCHRLNAFCLLIKREIIDNVGLLDERFGPGGYEDYDYCLRVRQAGYKIMLAGDVYVHHIGGQGYEPNKLDYNELRSVNKQIFINKWCRKALEIMEIIPDG